MKRNSMGKRLLLLAVLGTCFCGASWAGDLAAYALNIKDGRFDPEIIEVPAQRRFKLIITNHGPGPEEFESKELRKESVLAEGVTRSVVFAPLKPGVYSFFGEFHPDTAKGRIVVK